MSDNKQNRKKKHPQDADGVDAQERFINDITTIKKNFPKFTFKRNRISLKTNKFRHHDVERGKEPER